MYAVVEFTETTEVAVVPDKWLHKESSECFWPLYKKNERITSAVSKSETPTKNWLNFKVRTLLKSTNYEHARSKLKLAETTSDLATDASEVEKAKSRQRRKLEFSSEPDDENDSPVPSQIKQKRKKHRQNFPLPRRIVSESDGSSSNEDNDDKVFPAKNKTNRLPLSPLNPNLNGFDSLDNNMGWTEPTVLPHFRSQIITNTPTSSSCLPNHTIDSTFSDGLSMQNEPRRSTSFGILQNKSFTEPTNSRVLNDSAQRNLTNSNNLHIGNNRNSSTSSVLRQDVPQWARTLLTVMEDIKKQQKHTLHVVNQLLLRESTPIQDEISFNVPLQSEDEMAEIEVQIQDKTRRLALVNCLATAGGSTTQETTRRVLPLLLCNDLAKLFNWKGTKNKKSFQQSPLAQVVVDAVAKNPRLKGVADAKVAEEAIKTWLKHATDRSQPKK